MFSRSYLQIFRNLEIYKFLHVSVLTEISIRIHNVTNYRLLASIWRTTSYTTLSNPRRIANKTLHGTKLLNGEKQKIENYASDDRRRERMSKRERESKFEGEQAKGLKNRRRRRQRPKWRSVLRRIPRSERERDPDPVRSSNCGIRASVFLGG